MKITTDQLKASYRRMPDEELLELDREELTDTARACYDEEVARRGLDGASPQEGAPDSTGEEPWVAAGSCRSEEEAWRQQTMLESANIPARIQTSEERGLQIAGFQVQVPASLVEDARRLLGAEEPDAIIVSARYEGGVFKPLEEVEIQEGTVVEVHVPAGAILAGE